MKKELRQVVTKEKDGRGVMRSVTSHEMKLGNNWVKSNTGRLQKKST